MNYTENLSLGLPEYGESADVADLNRNSGILDAYCYNTRQIECEPYDSTKTYMSGDLSIHNEVVYECNTDNTTGTWDDSKWDSTTLAEQIAKAKQSGGGQVTKEASGNPIEFTDGADAPLVKCTTAIQGNQDLHGYDKPWVGGAGKNKLPMTVDGIKAINTSGTWSGNTYTLYGVTFTIETDGDDNVTGIKANGTATATATLKFIEGGSISDYEGKIASCVGVATDETIAMQYYTGTQFENSHLIDKPTEQYTIQNIGNTINVFIQISSGKVVSNTTFYPMIRLSTVSDSTFAPYSNICPITAYTEGEIEVRGKNLVEKFRRGALRSTGVLDADLDTSGVMFYAHAGRTYVISSSVTMDRNVKGLFNTDSPSYGSTALQVSTDGQTVWTSPWTGWTYWYAVSTYKQSFENSVQIEEGTTATSYEAPNITTHTATFSQSIYQGNADFVGGKARATWGYIASYNGETLPGEWISSMDEYAPGTTPTTGAQVAYELASPTEETITPTNLPIKSLFGYNHIESSTGDMEIEYITQGYQPLVDLIQSSNGHTYSTQEQVVGKWIDGRDLYECTFELSNPSGSGVISTGQTYDIAFLVSGYYVLNDGNSILSANQFLATSNFTYVHVEKDGDIQYRVNGYTATKLSVTIRYTKPTQTRSLSAPVTSQKAKIEPLTDKTEEVPTEEEKAVNEEENNDETR